MGKNNARRTIIIILAIVMLFGAAGIVIWRFMSQEEENTDPFVLLSEGFTDRKIVDEDSALAAIGDVAEVLEIDDVRTEFSNCKVNTVSGNTYYRFQQEYEGLPVYGRNVVVAADASGNSLSLSGNYIDTEDIDTSSKIDEASVLEIAHQHYGEDATIKTEGLYIYSLNSYSHSPELTWMLRVSTGQMMSLCFIAADDGGILYEKNLFDENSNREVLDSIGADYYTNLNGEILLSDNYRGIISVALSQEDVYADSVIEDLPRIACGADDDCDEYTTALKNLATSYDFFQDYLDLTSFDGNGGDIYLVFCDEDVGIENAMGNGHGEHGYLIIGTPDKIFSEPIGNALDIVGHEYTHMVIHNIVDLADAIETTAISEGVPDIFGNLIELQNYGVSSEVWQLGEDAGYSKYSMADPIDMTSFDHSETDGHSNAAIISHAAYLMWKGIDGSDAFEPLSTEELANLFYETLYTLPSDCTFSQFRALVQNTAEYQDLSNKQRLCISNAFFQVGITSAAMPVAKDHLAVDVYGIDGLPYNDYTLHVRHGNTENTYDGEIVKAEGITFPESGEYQLCVVDNANTDNQTTVTILAVEHGGAERMPIFTECGVSKLDGPIGADGGELPSIDYNNLVTEAYTETYTDEFGTYVWRIPEIMLSGNDVESINNEIWETLFTGAVSQNHEGIQQGDTFVAYDVIDYTWAVNGDILSLVITTNDSTMSWTDYYVYNVDVSTGSELSRDTLLNTYGYSLDEYYKLAEQVLGSQFWSGWDRDNENFQNNSFVSWFNDALQKTISQENIDQSFPYINSKGELCIIAKVYSLAGADYYWNNLNMSNFTLIPDYATPVESNTHTNNISGNGWVEAYKSILQQHPNTTSFTYGSNTSYIDTKYTVYDIDKNGTPELIVKEDMSNYYVYSFNGTDVVASDQCYWSYDDCLYEYEGNGIVVHSGGMGSMRIEDASLYSMVNNKLEWTETLMSTEACSFDELYSFLDSLTPINDFHPISDDSYLSN